MERDPEPNAVIFTMLCRNLLRVMPDLRPEQLTPDRSLTELGLNSLDRADVVTLTLEALRIDVPVAGFMGVKTLRELVRLFERYGAG